MKSIKFGVLQVNEFDSVYFSAKLFQTSCEVLSYKVVPVGSSAFDSAVFQICQQKKPLLRDYPI